MSCGKIGHNKCTMAERLSRDSQFNDLPNNEEDEVIITDNNINVAGISAYILFQE